MGALLAVVALAFPPAALAQAVPGSNPSLDEYVESLPVPEGKRLPKVPPAGRPESLAPETRRQLAAIPEGRSLEILATSPGLGAPERPVRLEAPSPRPAEGAEETRPVRRAAFLSALASAVGEGEGAPLGPILAILAAMVLAGGAAALRRRRRFGPHR